MRTSAVALILITWVSCASAKEAIPLLVKELGPAVVAITTYDDAGEVDGEGSGFFVSAAAEIITNVHVLKGATRAEVRTTDGRVFAVKGVVAENRKADLVKIVLASPPQHVVFLKSTLKVPTVGEKVVVIGNALGLEHTVSDGIVSGIREFEEHGEVFQITAPISPGSSGSPVVNMAGQVIGVATFGFDGGQNINFAIPGSAVAGLTTTGQIQSLSAWNESHLTFKELMVSLSLRDGISRFKSKDYEGAIVSLLGVIAVDPEQAVAHSYLGQAYGLLGRNHDAIKALKQAIRIDPDDFEAHLFIGVIYVKLLRNQEAIEAFEQALRIKPNDAGAHYLLGHAYFRVGDGDAAFDQYKTLVDLAPDMADDLARTLFNSAPR